MSQFSHIGRYIYSVLFGFETKFRDGSVSGGAGRFVGLFYPENRITTATSSETFPREHFLRYAVGFGRDNRNNVGPEMGSERWTPEPIVFLLRHPSNPLSLTPEAISEMLTPPINGTRVWQEAKLDLSAVIVNGQPAFFAVQNMAKALGYGAVPQPAPVAPAQSDDDLSISIVFDGPPGPVPGRFVEVEDGSGRSISLGRWQEDGEYWRLVIGRADVAQFFGHPVSAAPQPERTAPAATYVLTPLAPVEQRAGEIANLVEDAWNRDAPSWVRQIIPGSFVGNLAESVALIAIPIWRRAQERIAQRTAEILREGGK